MKTAPPALAVSDKGHTLSLALSTNLHESEKPNQRNLLLNGLACKLKLMRRENLSNKENFFEDQDTKLQERQVSGSKDKKPQTTELPHRKSSSQTDRNDSASSLVKSAKKLGKHKTETMSVTVSKRADSASSEQLPILSTTCASPFNTSLRSSSAGPIGGHRSLQSRMTSASSFFHSSESNGLVLESRGANYTIKVVKKDGVFQPIDKYASNRCLPRNSGPGERTVACDYEVFMLPASSEETNIIKHGSRDIHTEESRRPVKVSWSRTTGNITSVEMENPESRMDTAPTPFTPSSSGRILQRSSCSRPVYSSQKSRILSIGLRWNVPTVQPDDHDVKAQQSTKKPMWSWLVTPEAKKNRRLKKFRHLSRNENKSSVNLNRTYSNLDVRTQHSRDLHPVATAMAKEGTSVSKTKWLVPSSTISTLDAERIAMDRLEFVKRETKIRPDDENDLNDAYRNILAGDTDSNESSDCHIDTVRKAMDDTTSYGAKSITIQ